MRERSGERGDELPRASVSPSVTFGDIIARPASRSSRPWLEAALTGGRRGFELIGLELVVEYPCRLHGRLENVKLRGDDLRGARFAFPLPLLFEGSLTLNFPFTLPLVRVGLLLQRGASDLFLNALALSEAFTLTLSFKFALTLGCLCLLSLFGAVCFLPVTLPLGCFCLLTLFGAVRFLPVTLALEPLPVVAVRARFTLALSCHAPAELRARAGSAPGAFQSPLFSSLAYLYCM